MSNLSAVQLMQMLGDKWPMVVLAITPERDLETVTANIDDQEAYELLIMASQRAVMDMVARAEND